MFPAWHFHIAWRISIQVHIGNLVSLIKFDHVCALLTVCGVGKVWNHGWYCMGKLRASFEKHFPKLGWNYDPHRMDFLLGTMHLLGTSKCPI